MTYSDGEWGIGMAFSISPYRYLVLLKRKRVCVVYVRTCVIYLCGFENVFAGTCPPLLLLIGTAS